MRETIDRFMLRSEPTAAASIRRSQIGVYWLLAFAAAIVLLIAAAIVSSVVPAFDIERIIDSLGSARFMFGLCAVAVISAGLVTSGFCISPESRRLSMVALALSLPILALPATIAFADRQMNSEKLGAALVATHVLSVGLLALIFVRAVRSASMACDDFACQKQMRHWTRIAVAWVALVAAPSAGLAFIVILTKPSFFGSGMVWIQLAFPFYMLGVALPLTAATIISVLVLTVRMLRVAKREVAADARSSA